MSFPPEIKQGTLQEQLYLLFRQGTEEHFEPGVRSHFARELLNILEQNFSAGFPIIAEFLQQELYPEVTAEALRWIAYMEDDATAEQRRQLLEKSLLAKSAYIRDGALLGIASMDDPRSIPALEQAITREERSELRADMQDILEQLQETLGSLNRAGH